MFGDEIGPWLDELNRILTAQVWTGPWTNLPAIYIMRYRIQDEGQ